MDWITSWQAAWDRLIERNQLWYLELAAIVLVTLVIATVSAFFIRRLRNKAEEKQAAWLFILFEAARSPLFYMIWFLGLCAALFVVQARLEWAWLSVADVGRQVGLSLLVVWFLLRLVSLGEKEYLYPRKGRPADTTTVSAVGKLARIAVVVIAGLLLMQSLGYSISGLLAFGGVGGLAMGFAARDLLANFFGGLMIYTDRPFAVGDWVRSPDREIEGVVEDIGWRLTRIRTFDQRPLYVPNAVFNQVSLENPSRMRHRRIYETIGLRYADADKMADVVDEVRRMLIEHEDIETDTQVLIVNFVTFNSSSLDFFVYTFTKTVDWVTYHQVKQDVLLKILAIINSHNAEIAFPTSTLHLSDGLEAVPEAKVSDAAMASNVRQGQG